MTTAATIAARLILDAAEFASGLTDAEKKTDSFASKMSALGSSMAEVGKVAGLALAGIATAAVAGIGTVIKEGVEMNKFLELSTLQFTTLMGDAGKAKKHVEGLFKIAATTPFEAADIIGASKNMQTFGGAALNTKENILMVGDAAAAVGQPIGDVSFWVGRAYSMIQAGKPFGEAAMRLMEMGILSADARAELEKLQDEGASSDKVWGAFTKNLGKFGGAMKLQANTWEGLMATISDNTKLALGKALNPLFEVFKTGLSKIADFTSSETFTGWMKRLERIIASVSIPLGAMIDRGFWALFETFEDGSSYMAGILSAFGMTGDEADSMAKKINEAALWIKDVFDGIVETIQNDKGIVVAIFGALGIAIAAAMWPAIAAILPIIATFALVAGAIYLLYTAWTQNWGDIQGKTAELWAWLQPILQNVWDWLAVNVPIAIQTLSDFWTNTLLPALTTIWDWLATNIPAALQKLSDFWTGVLLPAVTEVYNWFMITLYPFFLAFASFLNTVFSIALTALAGIWQNVLLPAIQAVAQWLGEKLQPVFQALSDWWTTTGQPIAKAIAEWFGEKIAGAFVAVTKGIQDVTNWIIDLTNKLQNIQLPDWMTPGSPTPLEIGLLGINDALRQVSRQGLPDLNMGISAAPISLGGGSIDYGLTAPSAQGTPAGQSASGPLELSPNSITALGRELVFALQTAGGQ